MCARRGYLVQHPFSVVATQGKPPSWAESRTLGGRSLEPLLAHIHSWGSCPMADTAWGLRSVVGARQPHGTSLGSLFLAAARALLACGDSSLPSPGWKALQDESHRSHLLPGAPHRCVAGVGWRECERPGGPSSLGKGARTLVHCGGLPRPALTQTTLPLQGPRRATSGSRMSLQRPASSAWRKRPTLTWSTSRPASRMWRPRSTPLQWARSWSEWGGVTGGVLGRAWAVPLGAGVAFLPMPQRPGGLLAAKCQASGWPGARGGGGCNCCGVGQAQD